MGTRNRMMLAGKRIETEKNRIRPDFLNVGWNRLSEVNNRMFEALPTVFNGEINFVQEIYAAVNMISHINPLIEKYRANNGELSFSDSLHIILHYIALLEDESKSLGLSQIGFNAKYQVIFDQYYHLSLSLNSIHWRSQFHGYIGGSRDDTHDSIRKQSIDANFIRFQSFLNERRTYRAFPSCDCTLYNS